MKDKWDIFDIVQTVPGANESLELIQPTRRRTPARWRSGPLVIARPDPPPSGRREVALSMIAILFEQILNGLLVGSYYIVLSLGLSLIFSLGGVVNLAHGAFYALGAYFAYEVQRRLGFGGAVVLSPVGVALVGVAIERLFLRRLYREDPMLGLLFTFGLAMTAEQSLRLIWGTTGLPFSIPDVLRGQLLRRRLHLLVLPADGARGLVLAVIRLLAAAQQDCVRHDRARRHPRSGDGARARASA